MSHVVEEQTPASGAPELSILVVSYNTRAMTLDCLASVMAETRETSFEILVIDNASSDGSGEALEGLNGPLQVVRLSENIGFGRANNLAAQAARGRYLLLLNPDTKVVDGGIDRLMAFARANAEAGIWGGRTVFADGRLNPSCCWQRMTPWNLLCRATGLTGLFPGSPLFNAEAYGGWERDSFREVDIVSGCFFLVRHDLWQRLGGFDPVYFMYGEEADLCLRARALGARPLFTPIATIVHHGGASEATRHAKMAKLLAAKSTLIRRHWQGWAQDLGLALLAGWPLSRWLALALAGALTRSQRFNSAAAVWRDIWKDRRSWVGGYRRGGGPAKPRPSFAPGLRPGH